MKLLWCLLSVFIAITSVGCVSAINATNARHHAEVANEASKAGDWTTARTQWARALVNAQLAGAPSQTLAVFNYEYGRALGVTCFYDEAEKYLLKALELDVQTSGPTYMSLLELSRLMYDQKQYDKSIPYFRRTLEAIEVSGMAAKVPIDLADMLNEYADALVKTDNDKEAIVVAKRAQQLRTDNPEKQSNTDRTPYGTQCAKKEKP
jgi:tetratricopeptide (TPR) repeat protein